MRGVCIHGSRVEGWAVQTDLDCETYTGGIAQTNGYLLRPRTQGGPVILIDAPAGIAQWLGARGVRPDWLLLTHHHFDHVENAAAVAETGARVVAFARPTAELTLANFAASWGMPMNIRPFAVNEVLSSSRANADGGVAQVWSAVPGLDGAWKWAHVPGHSPDGIVFHNPGLGWLFAGDTLFAGSIGRTDLPGGDHARLIEGLRSVLLELPPETRVLPGHGPETRIGEEEATNPYLFD